MNAAHFLASIGVTILSTVYGGKRKDKHGWEHFRWVVTLGYAGREYKMKYCCGMSYQGFLVRVCKDGKNTKVWCPATIAEIQSRKDVAPMPPDLPTLAGVLHTECNTIESSPLWEDYADTFGMNKDSIADRKIYRKSIKQYQKLRKFLGQQFTNFLLCNPE